MNETGLRRSLENVDQLTRRFDPFQIKDIKLVCGSGQTVALNATEASLCEWQELLKPAQVGIGFETVLNTNVRKACDLGGADMACPLTLDFQQFLTRHLKISGNLSVVFDKVAVYSPGDFFLPHRDTVRCAEHFGTLLIGTNYEYTGGELAFLNNNKRTCVHLSDTEHVAFFTDELHQVTPVISGVRVVCQFMLCRNARGAGNSLYYFKNKKTWEYQKEKWLKKPARSEADDDAKEEEGEYDEVFIFSIFFVFFTLHFTNSFTISSLSIPVTTKSSRTKCLTTKNLRAF